MIDKVELLRSGTRIDSEELKEDNTSVVIRIGSVKRDKAPSILLVDDWSLLCKEKRRDVSWNVTQRLVYIFYVLTSRHK